MQSVFSPQLPSAFSTNPNSVGNHFSVVNTNNQNKITKIKPTKGGMQEKEQLYEESLKLKI